MRRPCLACGKLIARGSYCARREPSRKTPGRGGGSRERRFRAATVALTGGRCAVRGCLTPLDCVQAHHPLRVIDGGGRAEIGVPLCRRHHAEADGAVGRARPSDRRRA